MLRICTGFLLILGLLVTASCSKRPQTRNVVQQTEPSFEIKFGPEFDLADHKIEVFTIIPSGKPSGIFELKSVKNGKVELYRTFAFEEMTKQGSLALSTDEKGVDLAFDVECSESTLKDWCEEIAFPVGARDAGSDKSTAGMHAGRTETSIWTQGFVSGDPSSWMKTSGSWDTIVKNSSKQPDLRTYVLTVRLKQ